MAEIADLLCEATAWRQHFLAPGSMVGAIIRSYSGAVTVENREFEPEAVVERYKNDRSNRVAEFLAIRKL